MNENENETGRVSELRLDPGGPIAIRESDECGSSKGILLDVRACNNIDCKCRDAHLTVVNIDERNALFLWLKNGKTISSDTAERMLKSESAVSMRLNIDTGELTASDGQQIGVEAADLMLRLSRQLREKGLLEAIRGRFRAIRKETTAHLEKDWSWWEPGELVAWSEVFPDEVNLLFEHGDHTIFIDEQYCVTPGCNCKDIALSFVRLEGEKSEALGTLFVDLNHFRIKSTDAVKASSAEMEALLREFNTRYPGAKRLFLERHTRIRKAMAEVLPQKTPPTAPNIAGPRKVGRNDPCPCGSGLKYKKCCLALK